jgi:hypothetical protein
VVGSVIAAVRDTVAKAGALTGNRLHGVAPFPPHTRPHGAIRPITVRPPLGPCAATRGQTSTLTRQIPVQAEARPW